MCTVASLLVCTWQPLLAQAPWTATLIIDPYPSPYLSDWETNPNVSSLSVTNPTDQPEDVSLVYRVSNSGGQVLASGRSDPQTIPPGAPVVFNDYVDISGTSQHDVATEDQMVRTGRLPEGQYTACVVVSDAGSFVLAQTCADFTIVYPDPPLLLAPADGEVVTTQDQTFQWTPLQVPATYLVHFALEIAEVLPNQTPEEALAASIPHYANDDVEGTSFQYPLDAQPFETGKTYAWRVMALDQNGYPPSTNNGMSEIRTFAFNDGTAAPPVTALGARMQVTLLNDTTASTDTLRLRSVCDSAPPASGGTPQAYLAMNVPLVFPRGQTTINGFVYRADKNQALGKTRLWLLNGITGNAGWEYLMAGDCDLIPSLHWLAVRRTSETIESFLQSPDTAVAPDTASYSRQNGLELEYGVAVLSLVDGTVGKDDPFPSEAAFFDGHEVEVLRGLNLFGVVRFKEGPLWSWFRTLGYDTKEVELTGFAGFSNKLSLGGALGPKAGASATASQTFLKITAEFPKRTPQNPPWSDWIESMNLGLEIAVEAKEQLGLIGAAKSGSEFNIVPKLVHTIVLKGSGGAEGPKLEGSIGVEFNPAKRERKIVADYSCNCKYHFPVGAGKWWTGNPKLSFEYESEAMKLAFAGAFGADQQPLGIGTISLNWKKEEVTDTVLDNARKVMNDAQAARDSAQDDVDQLKAEYKAANERLALMQQLDLGASAESREAQADSASLLKVKVAQLKSYLQDAEDHLDDTQSSYNSRENIFKKKGGTNTPTKWAKPKWGASVSLGNMSLQTFFGLIRRWVADATGGP